MFQMQLVQPPHQGEVLRTLGHRFVIESAARNADQLALPLQAQFGAWLDQLLPAAYRPSCLHFFLSQSTSTLNWPIFSWSWAINCSWSWLAAWGDSNRSGK